MKTLLMGLKKLSLIFLIFSIYSVGYADLISTVYRADSRNYADVFNNGIISWGNNINFNAHILGLSTANGSQNSAFISTTSSYEVAERFAYKRASSRMQPYYIYDIRPTNNFYSASSTMYHLYDIHHVEIDPFLRSTLAREEEYAAYGYISPQQIRSVIIVTYINGAYTTRTIANPNYAENHTYANSNPYVGSDGYQLNNTPRLVISPPVLGASFMSDSHDTDTTLKPWTFCCMF